MNNKYTWFRDAKYGLFIHWGLYAIPAGEWGSKLAPHGSEWIMKNLQIPLKDYKELTKQFNPQNFDPYYYVRNAKKWGMKYLVFTSKHHDGFAMFDTKVSDYNIMNTPYSKDIVKQLADACREEGLTFGIYYSQMQDWEDPNGNGNFWDFDPEKKDFKKYFYGKCIPQVKELLTNYGEVGLMWFDTPYDMPEDLCKELADVVHSCQPNCLINSRIGYGLGDYRNAADNGIPVLSQEKPWEVPMTMNSSWGYISRDKSYKSKETIMTSMIRIVGRGGNLLLNLGPDANGLPVKEHTEVMEEIGAWLEKNGESIYNTTGTPDFPYFIRWGDLTCSTDKKTLYGHVTQYPISPFRPLLTGLKTKVKRVRLVATGENLKFTQSYEPGRDEFRLYFFLPEVRPDPIDTVVAFELDGEAEAQVLKW